MFWTIPIADSSVQINMGRAIASYHLSNWAIRDYHDIINALLGYTREGATLVFGRLAEPTGAPVLAAATQPGSAPTVIGFAQLGSKDELVPARDVQREARPAVVGEVHRSPGSGVGGAGDSLVHSKPA